MASYHLSAQIVKRSQGRSVVAMAAYRSGERLHDAAHDRFADYSNRRGVAFTEIMAPEGSAPWLTDRQTLWNAVEHGERRSDAQLAREINMALPHELTDAERIALVREFVASQFVSRGMVADVAIHRPVREKGENPRNHHAHVLLTLRQATPSGLREVKTREWNGRGMLDGWRAAWAAHQNDALRARGFRVQVDHRTLAAQRAEAMARGDRRTASLLDRVPEIHVGPRARQAGRQQRPLSSRPREAGPRRFREEGAPARRRVVDYPRIDRGHRIDWLTNLMLGNNERAKAQVAKLERQAARLRRKLDHWDRQATFRIDGAIRGARFRWERAKAAEEARAARERERQRQAHAAKRAAQVSTIIRELEMVLIAVRGGREAVLARQREIGGWTRNVGREAERGRGEGRQR
ncbi:MobQ family relaxase [Ancylobacter sp. IITR112]|uniref:MobQ family relaxase n=1 Tax=Ancylobacter sp. IITR112 TaxID=3138073 RepID=UPI00352AF31B